MSDISVATGDVVLDSDEAELVARTMDLAFAAADALGLELRGRRHVQALRERLAPTLADVVSLDLARSTPEPTRAQEHAADAMAAKYGRSGVRRQADGSVVITGMIDDVELETVCIETDGRERWRR